VPDDLRGEWPAGAGDARLTLDIVASILNAIRASGAHPTTAARLAAVPVSRFRKWMQHAGEPYATLARWIDLAEAFAKHSALAAVRASGDPHVALAFLARRFPQRWGRRAPKRAELLRSLAASADSGQRTAARERMRRVQPWRFRKSVLDKARRAADHETTPGP